MLISHKSDECFYHPGTKFFFSKFVIQSQQNKELFQNYTQTRFGLLSHMVGWNSKFNHVANSKNCLQNNADFLLSKWHEAYLRKMLSGAGHVSGEAEITVKCRTTKATTRPINAFWHFLITKSKGNKMLVCYLVYKSSHLQ